MLLAEGAGASAGPIGLLVVLLIALATVLLIKNMNSRLRRLPPTFDEKPRKDRPSRRRKTDDGSASGPTSDA